MSPGRRRHTPDPGETGPGGELEEGRIQHLIDELPAMIAYWDKDLRNRVANRAYLKYFGRTPEEMLGMHIGDLLGPEVYQSNLPHLTAALAGQEQHFQRTLVDTEGRERHTQATYVPDVVGEEVQGIFVLVSDVTPRVEAERELDEAQQIAGVGSWSLEPRTGELRWSREMFRLVGQDPATFVPSHEAYRSFIHPDDIERVRRVQDEKLWAGEDFDLRYRLVVDGEVHYMASRTRPVVGPDGEPVLLRGTVHDETDIQRQASALEATNKLLSNMVAMVGHDVRQPASVVLGNLEYALEGWPPDVLPGPRKMVERAYGGSRRLGDLVQDILTMISADTGDLHVRPERVDVAALVEDVVAAVAPGEVQVLGDRAGSVLVDPFHLRQAVANLIANARKYGAPTRRVEIRRAEDRVEVTVSDEGEGVPPDFVPHLFERFTRAPTGVATRVTGSGFGLFIVRELVEANGGTVGYAPNAPSGARFTITLPEMG